jgi:SAM-dependent methyltransferase
MSQHYSVVGRHPREDIGRTLVGEVLEVGPGHAPFPTSPDARVTFADRSVDGGRDATWPELAGQPRGPEAHIDIDLDVDGLGAFADKSFDGVIACHLIEHLANPIGALREFERVLRPSGRLILVVPDRTRTFDSVRAPTPFAHLLDDFARQVTEVDDEHIREFCEAIFSQSPIHPDAVRAWHDPERLNEARLNLHRRRTIHVHCWTPEEFAIFIAGCLALGLMSWELTDLYFFDDPGDQPDNEFGLVLQRPDNTVGPADQSSVFIRQWAACLLENRERDPRRLAALHSALLSNLSGCPGLAATSLVVAEAFGAQLVKEREWEASNTARLLAAEAQAAQFSERLQLSEQQMAGILRSRSYRASRILSAVLRSFRLHVSGGRRDT